MREPAKVSATIAGACTLRAQVSAGLPLAPNFMAAMKTTLPSFGSAATAPRSRRSHWIVSMPALSSLSRTAASEKRATPTTRLSRRRPLGHPCQRRSHLAGDAEHEDVACDGGEIGDELGRRRRHEILERRLALEAIGEGRGGCHGSFSGDAGAMRSLRGAGIGRMAGKSRSAATAKPGHASDPSASMPASMRSRAGPCERS